MPTYEYECSACGQFEVEQKITDRPLSTCPKCRQPKLRRLIGKTTFVLQGPRWARDGYGGKR